MKYNRVLVWFRNDLRVRDNEVLVKAALSAKEVIPVYCFDPRTFENTNLGFPKTGTFRAKFLIKSMADLRKSLRKIAISTFSALQKITTKTEITFGFGYLNYRQ